MYFNKIIVEKSINVWYNNTKGMMFMKKLLAVLLAVLLILSVGCNNEEAPSPTPTQTVSGSVQGELQVYFLDVGQADAALVIQNGYTMLIDGGNAHDGPDIIKFLKGKNITKLDVVVATHAHEDHVGSLSTIIDEFTVNKIYCPVNTYNSVCFNEFVDAAERQCGITLCKKGMNWNIGDARVNVFWPENAVNQTTNNTSIVLKLVFGEISFLFTGDAEHDAETAMVEAGCDLKADILKVGHHGSTTSSSYLFLRTVLPQIAIISVGEGNSYGHPEQEILDRYTQADVKVYRTDKLGTILISTDGKTIKTTYGDVTDESEKQNATPAITETSYIGNKNTKKFHYPSCSGLPKEENRVTFNTRDEAVDKGYSPCGICKP